MAEDSLESHSEAAASEPAGSPSRTSAHSVRKKRSGLRFLLRLLFAFVFVFGIYGSMKLGIHMAGNRLPDDATSGNEIADAAPITLGRSGDPVYLADSPESLRSFFTEFSTPGERASADLSGQSIRRITSSIVMNTIRAEADAVEVEVTSGAIAGSVYWVHHSQIPDPTRFDPILSPVPSSGETEAPAKEARP